MIILLQKPTVFWDYQERSHFRTTTEAKKQLYVCIYVIVCISCLIHATTSYIAQLYGNHTSSKDQNKYNGKLLNTF